MRSDHTRRDHGASLFCGVSRRRSYSDRKIRYQTKYYRTRRSCSCLRYQAPSAAVFVGKSVLLSEGTEANQDAKTQPEKLEHSVPEIVLNPTVVASWVNGIDIEKLKSRLQLHLACYTGQEMLRARNTDMYSRVLLNMKTAQAAEFILEMPCPQPAGLSRDDLVRTGSARIRRHDQAA